VRFLLLVVVIVAAIYMVRRALMRMSQDAAAPRPPAPGGELVSCARCGLHLPRNEAREVEGRLFCSDEHARLGAAPKG
jgi:uncharacterized protein